MENFKVRAWCSDAVQEVFEMKYDCPFMLRKIKTTLDDRVFFQYRPSSTALISGIILDVMLFTGVYDRTAWRELPKEQKDFWKAYGFVPRGWMGIPIFAGDYIRVLSQQLPKKTELQELYHKGVEWNQKTCGFNITMSQPNHQGFKVLGNKYEGMIYESRK